MPHLLPREQRSTIEDIRPDVGSIEGVLNNIWGATDSKERERERGREWCRGEKRKEVEYWCIFEIHVCTCSLTFPLCVFSSVCLSLSFCTSVSFLFYLSSVSTHYGDIPLPDHLQCTCIIDSSLQQVLSLSPFQCLVISNETQDGLNQ